MREFMLGSEPQSRGPDIGGWVLRAGVALFFFLAGVEKFPNDPGWVKMFDQIGIGQWFRYATGAVEIIGGILFLIPKTSTIAATILACTMLGAVLVHMLIFGNVFASLLPAFVLVAVIVVFYRVRTGLV